MIKLDEEIGKEIVELINKESGNQIRFFEDETTCSGLPFCFEACAIRSKEGHMLPWKVHNFLINTVLFKPGGYDFDVVVAPSVGSKLVRVVVKNEKSSELADKIVSYLKFKERPFAIYDQDNKGIKLRKYQILYTSPD
ncbi:MAG: hypothetical protein ABIH63_04455 [archaeon]